MDPGYSGQPFTIQLLRWNQVTNCCYQGHQLFWHKWTQNLRKTRGTCEGFLFPVIYREMWGEKKRCFDQWIVPSISSVCAVCARWLISVGISACFSSGFVCHRAGLVATDWVDYGAGMCLSRALSCTCEYCSDLHLPPSCIRNKFDITGFTPPFPTPFHHSLRLPPPFSVYTLPIF